MARSKPRISRLKTPFVVTVALGAAVACGGTTGDGKVGIAENGGDGGDGGSGGGDDGSGGGPGENTKCPAASPVQGAACDYEGPECPAQSPCYGSTIPTTARCTDRAWQLGPVGCNPPAIACPGSMPELGSACTNNWLQTTCTFPARCGSTISVRCDGQHWVLGGPGEDAALPTCDGGPIEPPPCPASDPGEFNPCTSHGQTCEYDYDCYGTDLDYTMTCREGRWEGPSPAGSCNPPPPTCPVELPAQDSECPFGWGPPYCTYDTACGEQVEITCNDDQGWRVLAEGGACDPWRPDQDGGGARDAGLPTEDGGMSVPDGG